METAGPRPFIARYRLPISAALHGLLFSVALLCAFLFAYNFRFEQATEEIVHRWFGQLYLPLLAIALPIKLLVFHFTKQYHGSWRYVGLRDLFDVISSSLISTFLFLGTYFVIENLWVRLYGVPLIDTAPRFLRQSVFPLDFVITIGVVSAAKVVVRFYYEEVRVQSPADQRRVLIVGAGDAGESLLREMLRMRRGRYECVGFVDDRITTGFHGRIHGVDIVGATNQLRALCEKYNVQEVLIALQHASPRTIRGLVEQCEGLNVLFRTVPPMSDVLEGRVTVNQMRDVEISDLLGRAQVELDAEKIAEQLRGRRVIVTGAGGSIGSEMCRQVAKFGPARLILVEQAENNLFEIERELRASHKQLDIVPYVADIVDAARMSVIFNTEKPSIVFHAAAHKHVPMMECNPGEAIKNNVQGTKTIADCAAAAGVERMVMISTDKAVNPTSIMGCTKRVAEMYVQGLNSRVTTQYVTVRFGNVLGSSGSVVPIFKQQIAQGGPVTVTHPEMTRYFMTIPEAAQLVLQAGAMGKGGEIFVLDMGEPVKIVDLARDMITLTGLRPGTDIEIRFSGVRPGEKLFEELMSKGEHIGDTAHPKIGIWKHRAEDWAGVCSGIERLLGMADTAVNGAIKRELMQIVPEYIPPEKP
jgi:FlaA1/EpsC-like NDP-sugar epimerase